MVIYKKIPEEEKNNASWDLPSHLDFAGAILLDLEGNKIKELGRISHTEWRNESCGNNSSAGRFYWWDTLNVSKDVQRVLEFQGNWVSFSPFGVKFHNKEDLNLVHQIKFSKDSNNSQCITEGYPSGI